MKKLMCVLCILSAATLLGCQAGRRTGQNEGTTVAVPQERFVWDKDLRPMVVLPTKPAGAEERAVVEIPEEVRPVPEAREQPRVMETRPRVAATEQRRVPVQRAEMVVVDRSAGVQPDLVAVNEAGLNTLSMVYPRQDYGIVQVDKIMPSEVGADKSFEYMIRITNLTDMMLSNLVVTEELPGSFSFESADPTPKMDGKKLAWEINSLGPRAGRQVRVSGTAKEIMVMEYCTSVTHTIRGCASVKVVQPTLELMVTAPADALLCEQLPVEFVVTNIGTGSAQNVQIVDALPAGLQTVDGRDKVVLDVGTLGAGQSKQLSVKLKPTRTGVYVTKAAATSASGLTVESAATTTTVRQAVLAIAKVGPTRQFLNRPIAYEITVTNKGDGPAMNTVVEDIIPPGVTSTEATTGAKISGSKLVWELGTLEPNTSQKLRVSYMALNAGDVMSTATATARCADSVTASAQTSVTGIGAIRLEVIDLEDPVEVGASTTYEIAVTNQGSAPDSNVRIVCTLDDRLRYVSSGGATVGSLMGKTVSFAPLRSLEPRTKAIWRVVVRGVRAGDIRFRATMSSDELTIPVEETEATHVYE